MVENRRSITELRPVRPVTLQERRSAARLRLVTAGAERKGARLASVIAARVRVEVIRVFEEEGRHYGAHSVVQSRLAEAARFVSGAMLWADLEGRRITRARATLVMAGYDDAIAVLQKRLGLSVAELNRLERLYDAQALRVLAKTGARIERRLQQAIFDAVAEGVHVEEGAARLEETFQKLGLTPSNSFQMEAIFRTQIQLAFNAGRWNEMQSDPWIRDNLWGFTYVTAGDDRVRPEHVGLEGTTAPKDDPIWKRIWTPNGWACRCQCIEKWEAEAVALPPPIALVDGVAVTPGPDKGFAFNAGEVFRLAA